MLQGVSPFEAVAATRVHLLFSLGGVLEILGRMFFFFLSQGDQ